MESLSRSQRRAGQRAALLSQLFGIMVTMVVAGEYMMLYANDTLGFSPQAIALIFSLAPIVSLLRLPALPYVQRFGLARTLRFARMGQGVLVLALIAVPAAHMSWGLLACLLALFITFRELGLGTVWQPLMRHITTTEDRGIFFGRMRTSFTLVNLSLSAGVALFVGQTMEELPFKVILGIAFFGTLNSAFWSFRIPEPKERSDLRRPPFGRAAKHLWVLLKRSRLFRLPLALTLVITLGQLPIGIVYFREALHVPASILGAMIFCATGGQALSLILWGRVSDSLGFRPMLAGLLWLSVGLSLLLWLVQPFPQEELPILEIVNANFVSVGALLTFGFVGGLLNAGAGIATNSAMHYHVSRRDSLANLNLFSLIQVTFQSVMILALGSYLQHVVIPHMQPAEPGAVFYFDWYKAYNAGFVPLVMILSIPMVMRLPDLKPWFTVYDFFAALRFMPWRSLIGSRRLHDEDEESRVRLARALGDAPNPLNIDPLSELLQDPSYEVKVEAIRSLARMKAGSAGVTLLPVLQDEARRALWDHAAWALGEVRYGLAVDTLIQRLGPENPTRARAMAARALGKIGDPSAVEALVETLKKETKSLHVVSGCCWALLRFETEGHASYAFRGLFRLREREERYELLSILSRWLGVTDRWILVSNSSTTAWQSLKEFIDDFDAKWRWERREIVEAFEQADMARIEGLLSERAVELEGAERALVEDLAMVLKETNEWSPLAVLAAAYLVFNDQGKERE